MKIPRWTYSLLATCVLMSSADALATERIDSIDAAYAAGELTQDQWVVYRLASVRKPTSLPEKFRKQVASSLRTRCHTPVTLAAHQALPRLSVGAASQVRALLSPPHDPPFSVEASEPFPVRVGYSDEALAPEAEQTLEAILFSYEKQVLELGFHAPPIDPAHGVYQVYLGDAQGAAGYTSPYAPVVETPHSDSYSYIVIDTTLLGADLNTTVTHEFNHACQLSMDAEEVLAFFENTATFIEGYVYPSSLPYVFATFPYFQYQPHRPLEYMSAFKSDLYEYGGSLFATFLVETYGQGDPRFIREVWEESMQEGSVNEPDYFDTLEAKLKAEGGMKEVAKAFAESRFFVGDDDDGRHMPNASAWHGAEVKRATNWNLGQLPLIDKGPATSETRPQPNGCNYIVLDTGQSPPPLHFSFSGEERFEWSVALLELGMPNATPRHDVPVLADGSGEIDIAPANFEALLAIVCQLGADNYDPDTNMWLAAGYSYSFDYNFPSPVVDSVTPAQLERGAHDVPLTIRGTGFSDYEGLEVSVAQGDLKLWVDEVVSSEEIRVTAAVPPSVALGLRDLIVTNPGGKAGTGVGLLTVVDPPEPPPTQPPPTPSSTQPPPAPTTGGGAPQDSSAGGCQIHTSPPLDARWWGLGLAALAAVTARRRRGIQKVG